MREMADTFPAQRTPAQVQLLLVDDDVALGELVCEFAAYEGYAVTTANTGELGLRTLARKSFALVILDVMLPGIDGFEVLERLRHFSDVPVLMLTTRGAASDRIYGLKIGADDYLPKPFEPDELLARVKSILRRIRPSAKGLCFMSIGDVERRTADSAARLTCSLTWNRLPFTESKDRGRLGQNRQDVSVWQMPP
jgi:DNA-binding response OmpR family regulator